MLLLLFMTATGQQAVVAAPASGGGGTAATARRRSLDPTDRLPLVRRRGAPEAYTRRAAQIERNNAKAIQIAKAIVAALTAEE